MQPQKQQQQSNNNNNNNNNKVERFVLSPAEIDGLVYCYLKSRGYNRAINALQTDLPNSSQLHVMFLFVILSPNKLNNNNNN